MAQEIAAESSKDCETIFKELTHREEVRELKNIRRLEKRGSRFGVDKVDIQTESGLKTVLDREGIERAVVTANKEKLLQASNTPLREEPLRTLIGERMEYEKWEQLLKKNVKLPDDLEEGTKLWFQIVQDFEDDPVDIDWTYFKNWEPMSEDKAALPGIQTSHVKSVDPTSEAADILSCIALIPLLTGYVPNQWRRGIDSMIPKKKNEWRPEKLRLILLMDARFNQNNKLISKRI